MRRCLAIGLALITWASYWPVLGNGFVGFDDRTYITDNPHVLGGLSLENILWAWTDFTGSYHPLTWMSLQLDATLFNAAAWGFHLTSLLLHTANVLLVFFILHGLTATVWRSAFVAALFAVHPMHVESVAWAAERKDVLSVFFWLLTIAAYRSYVKRPGTERYLVVVLALSAGLLSKAMLVTAPFVLLLLDVWPLRRLAAANETVAERRWLRYLLVEKLPLILLALVAAYIATQSLAVFHTLFDLQVLYPWQRFATTVVAYGWYLKSTLAPVNLAIYYPYDATRPFADDVVWTAAAVLLGITFAVTWCGRRTPALPVGWLWFLGTLFPVAAFAQVGIQVWADRYVYFPHIGLFIAVTWGANALREFVAGRMSFLAAPVRGVLAGAAVIILCGCACLTWLQVCRWRDAESIWRHTLAVTHDNVLAHESLAVFYDETKQYQLAIRHFNAALALTNHSRHHLSLARIYQRLDMQTQANSHIEAAQRTRTTFVSQTPNNSNAGGAVWLLIAAYIALLAIPPLWRLLTAAQSMQRS